MTSGQKIWLRSSGTDNAVLQATSKATVPTGNVYLYDGNTAGYTDGQKLILASTATLTTTVQAHRRFPSIRFACRAEDDRGSGGRIARAGRYPRDV